MKLAAVTIFDATDPAGFAGHDHFMLQTLESLVDSIEFICPLRPPTLYHLLCGVKRRFYRGVCLRTYTRERDRFLLRQYARQVSRRLSELAVDIVFSPMSPGSQPVAYLECDQPMVMWTDATFAAAIDFYPSFKNLCKETIKDGMANERAALRRCSLVIYSSEWAAQSAVQTYGIDPRKVHVVPFGANIRCDRQEDDIKAMIQSRKRNACKLLFIGATWERKGGDVAVRVAQELNDTGLDTQLTVLGCIPPDAESLPSFVKVSGYLSKLTDAGAEAIERALATSHFLILPTRADCTPFVFPEANSFGVPCITTGVGGIPTVITDGVNGKKFSLDADARDYATFIFDMFSRYEQYEELALSSFKEYESRLNWARSCSTVRDLMAQVLARNSTVESRYAIPGGGVDDASSAKSE